MNAKIFLTDTLKTLGMVNPVSRLFSSQRFFNNYNITLPSIRGEYLKKNVVKWGKLIPFGRYT